MFGLEKIDWANFSLADLKEKISVARAKDDFKKKVKKPSLSHFEINKHSFGTNNPL